VICDLNTISRHQTILSFKNFFLFFVIFIKSTGDVGTLNTSHDMIKLMPKLNPTDVADAVLYAISTPENVLVKPLIKMVFKSPSKRSKISHILSDSRINHQTRGRVLVNFSKNDIGEFMNFILLFFFEILIAHNIYL
jgi:hypothetical protein